MSKPYIATLDGEDVLWFLEDVVKAAQISGLFDREELKPIASYIAEIESLYESNESAYWSRLSGAGRRTSSNLFLRFCGSHAEALVTMRTAYATEIADRILHDRELCGFVAGTVMEIGFDGETIEGIRSQWVERTKWPAHVKRILHSRDRGKCAACGTDIVTELNEAGHIDHMFPISRGGCNDLVNLQLLCSGCNGRKLANAQRVATSVPRYLRRIGARFSGRTRSLRQKD